MHGERITHISHKVRHFGLILLQAPRVPIAHISDFGDFGFWRMGLVGAWVHRFPACILTPPKPPARSRSDLSSRPGGAIDDFKFLRRWEVGHLEGT